MAARIDPPRRIGGTNDYYYKYLCALARQIEYELNDRDRIIAELNTEISDLKTKVLEQETKINTSSEETADGEGEV